MPRLPRARSALSTPMKRLVILAVKDDTVLCSTTISLDADGESNADSFVQSYESKWVVSFCDYNIGISLANATSGRDV